MTPMPNIAEAIGARWAERSGAYARTTFTFVP
jgi:hypothetical protein